MLKTQQKEEKESSRVETRSRKANREIHMAEAFFVIVFAVVIIYFAWFLTVQSDETINSAYNMRIDVFSSTVVRGSILTRDGEILAETLEDEDGTEYRYYPYGEVFAHVVGYSDAGTTGIEDYANDILLDADISIIEQIQNDISGEKAIGNTVVTTLDADLQQLAYDLLGDYNGACVIMNPKTGEIYAMVSTPSFDPNTIAEDWEELIADEDGDAALLNRATQGLYPPGSTFKLLTALEFIREYPTEWESYTHECTGTTVYGDSTMSCYEGTAHGLLDLRLSLANSCNTSFAVIGQMLDGDSFLALCESMLFNSELPLSDGLEYYESSFVLNSESSLADYVQTAIGQGETLITPIHNALIVCAIANDGVLMTPYLIDSIVSDDGTVIEQYEPQEYAVLMTEEEAETLTNFMVAVVNEGTSPALQSDDYQVAGKTGSAEYSSDSDESHAWFVGFADAEDPEIVISIVFEEGGLGGVTAVAAAKEIFEAYFSEDTDS